MLHVLAHATQGSDNDLKRALFDNGEGMIRVIGDVIVEQCPKLLDCEGGFRTAAEAGFVYEEPVCDFVAGWNLAEVGEGEWGIVINLIGTPWNVRLSASLPRFCRDLRVQGHDLFE